MKLVNQENFDDLIEKIESKGGEIPPRAKFDGGDGGGDNSAMEARVSALEEAIKNLPTKTDFAELRADIAKGQADMYKAIADNHRWTHGALVGIGTIAVAGIIGVMSTIWTTGKPSPQPTPPQASQPIIINVPPASTPAVPPAPASAPAPAPAPQKP
ncbi:hypothetical protein [Delftia acidovorans]